MAPSASPVSPRRMNRFRASSPRGDDVEPPGLGRLTTIPSRRPLPLISTAWKRSRPRNGKEAADDFSKAIDAADNDEPVYFRSRGIGQALAENLSPAIADLRRATKLDPADKETRSVWLAAAVGMSGDPMNASNIYPPATLDPYETFVGQLRVDYGQLAFFQKRGDVDPKFVARRPRPNSACRKPALGMLAG